MKVNFKDHRVYRPYHITPIIFGSVFFAAHSSRRICARRRTKIIHAVRVYVSRLAGMFAGKMPCALACLAFSQVLSRVLPRRASDLTA
jgi:hypothetical protein